jgi:hypothetical protein
MNAIGRNGPTVSPVPYLNMSMCEADVWLEEISSKGEASAGSAVCSASVAHTE